MKCGVLTCTTKVGQFTAFTLGDTYSDTILAIDRKQDSGLVYRVMKGKLLIDRHWVTKDYFRISLMTEPAESA